MYITDTIPSEREVKKANRDLSNLLSTLETPMSRLDILQRKYTDLLADMKRTEREYNKTKKRADQLQKEKDASRSELSKMTTVKDKLEKLCRELQKDNKKLKVGRATGWGNPKLTRFYRTTTSDYAIQRPACAKSFTKDWK